MTDQHNPSRAAFEAHWRSVRPTRNAARELVRREDQPQVYVCDSTNRHWITWQAARKAALEEAYNACMAADLKAEAKGERWTLTAASNIIGSLK